MVMLSLLLLRLFIIAVVLLVHNDDAVVAASVNDIDSVAVVNFAIYKRL